LPLLFIGTIEESDRSFWGALAEGGAATCGFLENGPFIEMNLTVSDRSGMGFVSLGRELSGGAEVGGCSGKVLAASFGWVEVNLPVLQVSREKAPVLAIPAIPGKASRVQDYLKASLVEGNDLGPHPFPEVFALNGKIRRDLGILGVDVGPGEILLGREAKKGGNEGSEKEG
tara:strand:- start:814 stop:1329 length:516 start_codon:yes stop_codon:yes gene_type:complete